MTESQYLSSTDPAVILTCLRERGLIDGNTPWKRQPKMIALDAALQDHGWVGVTGIFEENERHSAHIDPYTIACRFIRDIWGNPFRAWFTASERESWLSWNDGIVPKLARAILGEERCEKCNGKGDYSYYKGPGATNVAWKDCQTCHGTGKTPSNFADMPILADALEESGCVNEEILRHCRGRERCGMCCGTGRGIHKRIDTRIPGPNQIRYSKCDGCEGRGWLPGVVHTRGCWVLRLLTEAAHSDLPTP